MHDVVYFSCVCACSEPFRDPQGPKIPPKAPEDGVFLMVPPQQPGTVKLGTFTPEIRTVWTGKT